VGYGVRCGQAEREEKRTQGRESRARVGCTDAEKGDERVLGSRVKRDCRKEMSGGHGE